jgi:hypothetical protein
VRDRRRSSVQPGGLHPMQFAVDEPVADAPDVDHQRVGAVPAQLAPQPGSVAVDRPGPAERLKPPHPSQQLIAGEYKRILWTTGLEAEAEDSSDDASAHGARGTDV